MNVSIFNELMEQGYTEEEIEAIIGLGGLGSEEADLERQQTQADRLRNQAAPQGLNPTGRVYTAQNPLEQLAHVGQVGLGEMQNQQIDQREREIWQEQQRRRVDFLRKQANKEPATVQPAGVPGAPPQQVMV